MFENTKSTLNRRRFLKVAAMSATAMAVQACASSPAESPAPDEPAQGAAEVQATPPGSVTEFNEAPMLQERVQAGDLPPVDERLLNPEVINPLEEIGQYGGVVRVAIGNPNALFGDPQAVMGSLKIGLWKCSSWSDYGQSMSLVIPMPSAAASGSASALPVP